MPFSTQRRKRLIRPSLQLKLIGTFLAVATLAFLAEFVLLGYRLSDLAGRLPEGGGYLTSEIPDLLLEVALVSFLVLLPATLLAGIAITFRIAGPVYRFEQYLGALARGEDPGLCRIREKDELQELCGLINAAVATLREPDCDADSAPSESAPSALAG